MTKDEINQMVNTCNNYYNCGLCPYNPEDISRFIGDRWKGGCPNYDRKLVYAMGKGYGNISEYEAEIKRLEEKCEELLNEKWGAQDDLDCYYDEMPTRINQAVQDFVEKAKAKSEMFLVAKGGGVYGEKPYVSIEKIDELLKEYE